ncbi:Fanconi anemia group C protein [Pholidichthys leucotaenia]
MSEMQLQSLCQQREEFLLDVKELQFWLDKAVSWGQADSLEKQKDTCLHLRKLMDFLQRLFTHITNLNSTAETLKRLPFLGQFLGRLCWNPYVTAGDTSRKLVLQCLWGLYSEHPSSAVERKANHWIRKVLCQLTTEEDDNAAQALMKLMGVPAKEYHQKVLKKMIVRLEENVENSNNCLSNKNQRCSCDSIPTAAEACVLLLTCPEASFLIGALLQKPVTCVRDPRNEDFLEILGSAYSSQGLLLDEPALVSLWHHHLSSLEEAVVSLLESVTNTGSTPQKLDLQVSQSLLPKACAQHCSIFLVTNDIFRSVLKQAEGNEPVKFLIQTFTRYFLKELALLQPQTSVPLKAFFPQSPPNLLVPLLTVPSDVPQDAWRNHLNWISLSLQTLTEEEEDRDSQSTSVFESWFLLVQCAHWVQVAVQLLATSGAEDCGPLLWLLTFYHHPTNKWHCRASQLVRVKEVWDHIRTLFLVETHPLLSDQLCSLVSLLSLQSQQPSLTALALNFLVHFAAFCQLASRDSSEILKMVLDQSGLVDEAAHILSSLELSVNEGNSLSRDRVHLRIKELQNTITQNGLVSE